MNELITIIVPIYKVEDYIHRCVNSIQRQTYKNLEIILVDDGSPDNCGDICDEYAKLDKRVKVIHKKNGGLSDARNKGIEIAKGEYISFVDSDDWIHETYIEKLYGILKKSNSDISICNFIITSTENIKADVSKEEVYEYSNVEALAQIYGKFGVQMIVAWGKLYKKNLFEQVRFPVGRIHEDEFTTYKLVYMANKIALTTMPLLYYFQREDSIIGTGFNLKHKQDALAAFEERAEFFSKAGLDELSSKTYKLVFFIYLTIIRLIDEKESSRNFKQLRHNLRRSKQKVKFRVFYEMYFVAPKTMWLVYKHLYQNMN